MGDRVFANGRAVVSQSSSGKSVAAFPDVCLTPPPPPTGPIPVPYPNTALASDLAKGSKTVSIEGKPVALRDQSYFKTSSGDEAGTQGGGVITRKTKGKAYFSSWSMDVKVEGKNVCRHLDTTMHNAASHPRNTPTWPYLSKAQNETGGPCEGVDVKFRLTAYSSGCPDGKTPHHFIPDRTMHNSSGPLFKNYTHGGAPCICVSGKNQHLLEHGNYHAAFDRVELRAHKEIQAGKRTAFTYSEAREAAIQSARHTKNNTLSKQASECLRAQLDSYFKDHCGATESSPLRVSGKRGKNNKETDSVPPVDV